MPSTFNVKFTRKGIPSYPVARFAEDNEYETDVSIQMLCGCFNNTIEITAWDGETKVYIHTTQGHFFNWCVVILNPDTAPQVIQGPEYEQESKIEDAFDAISKEGELSFWDAALPKIKEWLDTPTTA